MKYIKEKAPSVKSKVKQINQKIGKLVSKKEDAINKAKEMADSEEPSGKMQASLAKIQLKQSESEAEKLMLQKQAEILKAKIDTAKKKEKTVADIEEMENRTITIQEGVMSDIHQMIGNHKTFDSFQKEFFKEYGHKKVMKKTPEFLEWLEALYNDSQFELAEANAKPGPDPYMRGLDDDEADKKEDKMKKQAEMDDDDPDAYKELPGDKEAKDKGEVKTSKHVKKYHELYGDKKDESVVNEEKAEGDRGKIADANIEKALKTKSEETGVPIGLIRIVMRRGMAAWKTGHRPGATEQQWGYARVNAFLTKGEGTWGGADKDVAKEVRDGGHDKGLKERIESDIRLSDKVVAFKTDDSSFNGQSPNTITCNNCTWTWMKQDGGDDMYVCHKCGTNNAPLLGESVDMHYLDNAKDSLEPKKVYQHLGVEYGQTRRGDKYVQINYIPVSRPQSQQPEWVKVFYDNDKDLKKISKELDMDLKESVNEAKFPGRKGDFIKWKDGYYDIKKTSGSTAYVKFPHTASSAFSQVWGDEITSSDEKHRGKKVWLLESNAINEEDSYNDYPAAAKKNAKKALDWRDKYGRDEVDAGTAVGWTRANQLAKGEKISADTVKRMASFNRHRKNSSIKAELKGTPWKDKGYVSWLIWGGDEGVDWAMKKSKEIDDMKNESKKMKYIKPLNERAKHASTDFSKPGNDGDIYFSKREGDAVGVRLGDKLQNLYVFQEEPKLGRIQKSDKRWENMGPASEELLIDLRGREEGKILFDFVSTLEESKVTEGMSKSAIKKAIKVIDQQIEDEEGGDGEPLDNETLQALEQERERLLKMSESLEYLNEAKIKITKNEWPYLEFKVGSKKHKVDFDYEDIIDDHGNEGQDQYWIGKDEEGQEWMIDVYANYMGDVEEVHYDTIVKESVSSEFSPMGYAKRVVSGAIKIKDAMKEAGISLANMAKLIKRIDKSFDVDAAFLEKNVMQDDPEKFNETKSLKYIKPLSTLNEGFWSSYDYEKWVKDNGRPKYPKWIKSTLKEIVKGGFMDPVYDSEHTYMVLWLASLDNKKRSETFAYDKKGEKEFGKVGYAMYKRFYNDLTGYNMFFMQGAMYALEVSKNIKDRVANGEPVEPAYYMMKEYFNNMGMDTKRSRIFNAASEKLEKWMKDNSIPTL